MKTATIIDLIVDSDVHTQSMNHIIKQQHISQRMRRRLRNDGIITVNGKPAYLEYPCPRWRPSRYEINTRARV